MPLLLGIFYALRQFDRRRQAKKAEEVKMVGMGGDPYAGGAGAGGDPGPGY